MGYSPRQKVNLMHDTLESDILAIQDVENKRCELISSNDIDGFGKLLSQDYVHVHVTGRIDDKDAALSSFRKAPRQCWRGPLAIRIFGDIAIASGPQINRMVRNGGECEDRTLIATTILHRQGGDWKIVHFHACSAAR